MLDVQRSAQARTIRGIRRAALAAALLAAWPATGSAQCPSQLLAEYTGAGTVVCPCFLGGEEAGAVLDAPQNHYPIEILSVGIAWASQFGGNPPSLEQAVHIYPSGLPNPGAPQFSLPGPQMTDGFINTFNIQFTPGNKIIQSGPFSVSLEFFNTNAGQIFASSVAHDGNGCQGGKNTIFAIPGGWIDSCGAGVTGDWVMEVTYRRVNCAKNTTYSTSTPLEGATGTLSATAGDPDAEVVRSLPVREASFGFDTGRGLATLASEAGLVIEPRLAVRALVARMNGGRMHGRSR